MKLLIAADIFPPESGGPATYVVTLANELAKRGVDVRIVSLNPKSDASKVSCPVHSVTSSFKPLRYWQYYQLLRHHGRDLDVIYAMGPVNAGWPALRAAKKLGKKFVVKVVGDYAWEQGQVGGLVRDSIDEFQTKKYGGKIGLLKKIESTIVRQANVVIVPCKYLAKIVEGWGADKEKIQVIYNEVENVTSDPLPHPGEKWLVSVGRLVPWKGMSTLIDVISDISNQAPASSWKLKIVGDGPEMKNLKKKVTETKTSNIVELVGNLPKDKTLAYVAAADVFILNSAYEGLAHVLIEAHNQGVPVLASKAGGNSEIVSGDSLFEYNNTEEIKEKVLRKSLLGKGKSIPHRFSPGSFDEMVERTKETLVNVCKS